MSVLLGKYSLKISNRPIPVLSQTDIIFKHVKKKVIKDFNRMRSFWPKDERNMSHLSEWFFSCRLYLSLWRLPILCRYKTCFWYNVRLQSISGKKTFPKLTYNCWFLPLFRKLWVHEWCKTVDRNSRHRRHFLFAWFAWSPINLTPATSWQWRDFKKKRKILTC